MLQLKRFESLEVLATNVVTNVNDSLRKLGTHSSSQQTLLTIANSLCLYVSKAVTQLEVNKAMVSSAKDGAEALFQDVHKQQCIEVANLDAAEKRRNDAAKEEAKLSSMIQSYHVRISEENAKIRQLEHRIEQERTKQQDAATDWIPGVGFFGGLITGRYERMIPFHSTIAAIISAIEGDLGRAIGRRDDAARNKSALEQEQLRVKQRLEESSAEMTRIQRKIDSLKANIGRCDDQVKVLGALLTDLGNLTRSLLNLATGLTGIHEQVENLIDCDMVEPAEFARICRLKDNVQFCSKAVVQHLRQLS